MITQFTGRHMAAIMVAFFSVVIAVNFTMARLASSTFGGVVVANSYVASQRFNDWLGEARAQDRLGWRAEVRGGSGGRLEVELTGRDGPLANALVAAQAEHPVGRLPGRAFVLTDRGNGIYAAPHGLAPGRWRVTIEARRDGADARFQQDLRL